jgi:hypothetical protein
MESLNIIHLIEKNAMTRLSKDYENKLINKIKYNFSDNQQQLFVASFYIFLNYDAKRDFVIDFDNVWKWLGFTRKDNAKRLLEKFFTTDIDYKIVFLTSEENSIIGRPYETILLNVNTFKKFCLKAGTKKADEVHDYYIKLEELLQETINEETNELRKQLEYKEKEKKQIEDNFIDLSEKHFKLEENHKRILYKNKRHRLKKGPCLYLLHNPDIPKTKKMIKLGRTNNLNIRRTTYNTYLEPEFLYVMFTNNNSLLEDILKVKYKENIRMNSDEWLICVDYKEIIDFIEMQAKLLNIEFTSHTNISEIEITKEDENIDENVKGDDNVNKNDDDDIDYIDDDNIDDKIDDNIDDDEIDDNIDDKIDDNIDENIKGNDMKKCSKCLVIQEKTCFNKDKSKKDGYRASCKICEKITKQSYKDKKEKEFVPLTEKKCVLCNTLKDILNFSKHLYNKDGYVNNCLECAKEITNKARLNDKNNNIRYKCANCDKDYARKDTLLKHTKTCQKPTEI